MTAGLSFSAFLAQSVGLDNIKRASRWGQMLRAGGPTRSSEFRRIEAIPRRQWINDPTLDAVTQQVTEWLKTPAGTMSLWPNQAAALIEAGQCQGLFAPLAVGRGKALISLLAPVVMGAERPVLFVPAQLRDQTIRRVLPEMRKHWRLHPALRVVGYSELSLAKNKSMLATLQPDLIILDEAHSVKNASSARTKRLKEYLKANPLTRVVVLSGTITRRSLKDYWQLLLWALKPDRCPLPCHWPELTSWADALDQDVPDEQRQPPGALLRFCADNEEAREGYQRRLTETPGVVASGADELGVGLEILASPVTVPGPVRLMMETMRRDWVTPCGDTIVEAVDLWRHMRELACGFYYRWDPLPPRDWLDARAAWKKYVRDTLSRNRRGLDSELLVARECAGMAKPPVEWTAWQEIKDTFEINTVAEWVGDFALRAATDWMNDVEDGPGIVWTEHVAFGERLAAFAGRPYFGAGMKASAQIGDAKGPIIASIAAHGEGKNLQTWARNLVTAPPSSGKTWEQLLGRTHRHGQAADTVVVNVWLHADELRASLERAIGDAHYIEQTIGARQKLCYADISVGGTS